jgi:hypothetical protein
LFFVAVGIQYLVVPEEILKILLLKTCLKIPLPVPIFGSSMRTKKGRNFSSPLDSKMGKPH